MKILQSIIIGLAVLVGSAQADWTSVKFIDRVNTAVKNGNVGPQWVPVAPKINPAPSGWTSPKFIDRVNAWQERMPKRELTSVTEVIQPKEIVSMQQEAVNFTEVEKNSLAEKAKWLVNNAKDVASNLIKNVYDNATMQNVLTKAQDNKKVITGVALGAAVLYGGYKLYSYITKPSKSIVYDTDNNAQEEAFQKRYEQLTHKQEVVSSNKATQIVSSMNQQAQMPAMMKNVNGILTEQSRLQNYHAKPSNVKLF
ncbi:MAG: hypothetical protein ACOYT8_02680 [Candidatus Dependentiae bacterium]